MTADAEGTREPTPRRRVRARTVVRWSVTIPAVLFAAALVISLLADCRFDVGDPRGDGPYLVYTVRVVNGRVFLVLPPWEVVTTYAMNTCDISWHPLVMGAMREPSFWIPWKSFNGAFDFFYFPLWMPAALFVPPAAWMWRTDLRIARRARAGQCVACGYSRAGLAAGAPCPECAAAERK